MPDFHIPCPHCTQRLECSAELAGSEVTCPVCETSFRLSAPPGTAFPAGGKSVTDQVKHWIVDARILLLRAPPGYVKTLMEVPKSWILPQDGNLPGPAFEAVTKAIRTRFPECPITPVKVRVADPDALKRISGQTDYRNESCKAWFLGRATLTP